MYVMQFWEIRSNKRMVTSYSIKYQDAPFHILDQFYTRENSEIPKIEAISGEYRLMRSWDRYTNRIKGIE